LLEFVEFVRGSFKKFISSYVTKDLLFHCCKRICVQITLIQIYKNIMSDFKIRYLKKN